MKIIIMGCGRVGGQLALLMETEGHDVTIIDSNPNTFARLGPKFRGKTIVGIGFDRNILIEAGIEKADAFAAASPSDNANVVAARIARNIFLVPRVVARLFDPDRAEVYRRLGLLTISSTMLGAERLREMLLHPELDPTMGFGGGEVSIISIETSPNLIGRIVKDISVPGEVSVASITRDGRAFIPNLGTEFKEGDFIHLIVLAESMSRFKELLGLGEGG